MFRGYSNLANMNDTYLSLQQSYICGGEQAGRKDRIKGYTKAAQVGQKEKHKSLQKIAYTSTKLSDKGEIEASFEFNSKSRLYPKY